MMLVRYVGYYGEYPLGTPDSVRRAYVALQVEMQRWAGQVAAETAATTTPPVRGLSTMWGQLNVGSEAARATQI